MIFFLLFVIYIFAGYPLILFVLSKFYKKMQINYESIQPLTTVVIPARNEASVIAKKIENLLNLNYPSEFLEILVISDQSTDLTETIVNSFSAPNIRLISLKQRQGKTEAQNIAVNEAKGEIIVFSDANALYDPNAIHHLIKHFADPDVGCVSGELCYNNPENSVVGEEESLYWKYENWMKRMENQVGIILGANGSIYAVRKTDYVPLAHDTISDFIEPLIIAGHGKKVLFEPSAKSYEDTCDEFHEEFSRKRRIVSRSLYGLLKNAWILNPIKHPILSFELISHKLLRWMSPFIMIMLFFSTVAALGQSKLYFYVFILQCIFYGLAILGMLCKNRIKMAAIFYSPYYFCTINYAAFLGVLDYIKGTPAVFWEPIRKE